MPSGWGLADDPRLAPFLLPDEVVNLRQAFYARPGAPNRLEHAFTVVQQLRAARVPILAGSDAPNPGTAHGASLHRELELLVAADLRPVEALAAATSAPARAFGLADRGRNARGLRADLVLVRGNPGLAGFLKIVPGPVPQQGPLAEGIADLRPRGSEPVHSPRLGWVLISATSHG